MNRKIFLLGLIGLGIFLISLPKTRGYIVEAYEKLKSLIAGEEGLSLKAYKDQVGKWTIGYGHLIRPGEPYHPYGPIKEITQDQAEKLFMQDIASAERCVKNNVKRSLTNSQYAALVSFVFNVGCTAFTNSTLLKKLNANDPSAAQEFDKWVYGTNPNGEKIKLAVLVNRRLRERDLFMTA